MEILEYPKNDRKKWLLVGKNSYYRQALMLASTVAPTDATTMIRGESGSGKELLDEAIQKSSNRKDW